MRDDRGFTLIEVLVIVVLIGVLSALAISQYAGFRSRSFESKVTAAVRGAATGEEAYYAENLKYAADAHTLKSVPEDVHIVITAGNSGDLGSSFRITGTHPGTQKSATWISDPSPGEPNFLVN